MKSLENIKNKIVLFIMAMLVNIYAFAQEEGGKVDVNVTKQSTTTTTTWFAEPWVWVVGAAVFILLFAAIIRSGGARRSDA